MKKKVLLLVIICLLFQIDQVYAVGFGSDTITACGFDYMPKRLPIYTSGLYNLLKILVPIILIILGMVDFTRSMMGRNDSEIEKNKKRFITRLIAAIVVFLILSTVQFVFKKIDNNPKSTQCMNCLLNNECSGKIEKQSNANVKTIKSKQEEEKEAKKEAEKLKINNSNSTKQSGNYINSELVAKSEEENVNKTLNQVIPQSTFEKTPNTSTTQVNQTTQTKSTTTVVPVKRETGSNTVQQVQTTQTTQPTQPTKTTTQQPVQQTQQVTQPTQSNLSTVEEVSMTSVSTNGVSNSFVSSIANSFTSITNVPSVSKEVSKGDVVPIGSYSVTRSASTDVTSGVNQSFFNATSNVPKTNTSGKSIVFFGDSLTAGYQGPNVATYSWATYILGKTNAYEMQATKHSDFASGYNAGVSDSTISNLSTYGIPSIISQVMAQYNSGRKYDYVILSGGGNDVGYIAKLGGVNMYDNYLGTPSDYNKNTYAAHLNYTINYIKRAWPNAKIGFIIEQKMPSHCPEPYHGKLISVTKQILNNQGVKYLDLYDGTDSEGRNFSDVIKSNYTLYDNVHINIDGYNYLSPHVYNFINSL